MIGRGYEEASKVLNVYFLTWVVLIWMCLFCNNSCICVLMICVHCICVL